MVTERKLFSCSSSISNVTEQQKIIVLLWAREEDTRFNLFLEIHIWQNIVYFSFFIVVVVIVGKFWNRYSLYGWGKTHLTGSHSIWALFRVNHCTGKWFEKFVAIFLGIWKPWLMKFLLNRWIFRFKLSKSPSLACIRICYSKVSLSPYNFCSNFIFFVIKQCTISIASYGIVLLLLTWSQHTYKSTRAKWTQKYTRDCLIFELK